MNYKTRRRLERIVEGTIWVLIKIFLLLDRFSVKFARFCRTGRWTDHL